MFTKAVIRPCRARRKKIYVHSLGHAAKQIFEIRLLIKIDSWDAIRFQILYHLLKLKTHGAV